MDSQNLNQLFANAFSHPFFTHNNPFRSNANSNDAQNQQQNFYFNQNFQPQQPQDQNFQQNYHFNQNAQQPQQQPSQQNQSKNKKKKSEQEPLNENSCFFWKQKGNEFFQRKDYQNAIQCYTHAIKLNDTISVFYSNRAQCYRAIQEWQLALKDSISAIELDDKSIKAHLICGICLAQFGKYEGNNQKLENALTKLTKAFSLCSGQDKKHYEKQLYRYILLVRKIIWLKNFQNQKRKYEELLTRAKVKYLFRIMFNKMKIQLRTKKTNIQMRQLLQIVSQINGKGGELPV